MGKAGRWLKSFLTGKRDDKGKKDNNLSFPSQLQIEYQSAPIQVVIPKDKKRWSFRRSVGAGKSNTSAELLSASAPKHGISDVEIRQKRHEMAIAVATAEAADAAAAAAKAAAAVVRLTSETANKATNSIEENAAAAIKIQAAFRAYLARKALCALRGLVKLQALVRGHLVRRQAATALRCMQALVAAQTRVREERVRNMVEETQSLSQRPSNYRRSPKHPRSYQSYDIDINAEENVKIVEVDFTGPRVSTKSRNSYSYSQSETRDLKFMEHYNNYHAASKADKYEQNSPALSALTEMSPRAYSGHFEDFSFTTAQSSPQYLSAVSVPDQTQTSFDYSFFPNYMANTESSRAKARSQSAPRQRTDTYERQSSRRRPSVEGRNIPRSVKMQRSSSHVGSTANSYQYPWSIKLDKSSMSLEDSECGSSSTVMTNINYCRSLVGFEVNRKKF